MRSCRLLLGLTAALVLFVTSGCEHGHDHGEGTPSGADCPEDSTLTWDSFGKDFMSNYCTRCHSTSLSGSQRSGAPSDHNFETAALVREQLEHIDEGAAAGPDAVNTAMPIGDPQPTEDERRQLGEWIACGAP
ncbi:hypothetical protein [Nannocystis punicea]|uniref:Cytochrome c domain-containing protein n=1 Tax=Nannocystis punicea TaxID=2995304 RepID=A0ABY7GWA8_9BACT|nr:hypothetical protein [Nannocystis poenicansa]WAS91271.1 hypothetical protein O0S08_34220 [Nannocystis poenicansa]